MEILPNYDFDNRIIVLSHIDQDMCIHGWTFPDRSAKNILVSVGDRYNSVVRDVLTYHDVFDNIRNDAAEETRTLLNTLVERATVQPISTTPILKMSPLGWEGKPIEVKRPLADGSGRQVILAGPIPSVVLKCTTQGSPDGYVVVPMSAARNFGYNLGLNIRLPEFFYRNQT